MDHAMQLYGATFILVIASFPLPFILVNYLVLMAEGTTVEEAKTRNKENQIQRPTMVGDVGISAGIVCFATLLFIIEASFRAGTSWAKPAPPNNPEWYDSKACLYLFTFVPELVVVVLYAAARIDRLFFVPAKNAGHVY
jgi:hypothetical protein